MSEERGLLERIEAEFSAWNSRRKELQEMQLEQHHEREERAQQFERVIDEMREIWRPRLETLAERFGERVQVKPSVSPGRRNAVFQFQSPVARIALTFTVSTNADVTDVVLSYDLDILPMLMQFNKHAELKCPLDGVDRDAVAAWFDDRIIDFVKTYLSLHENEFYLKDQMVEDPIAHVRFPKFAAGATLEQGGKELYFLSDETRQQYEQQAKS